MWTAVVIGALAAMPHAQMPSSEPECVQLSINSRWTTVQAVVAHPERWNCKRVRLIGVAVRAFENSNLYASSDDLCRERPKAIAVDWYSSSAADRPRFIRMAEVEGTFRDFNDRKLPSGEIIMMNSWAGPGPLKDVRVVRWLSAELPRCKRQ